MSSLKTFTFSAVILSFIYSSFFLDIYLRSLLLTSLFFLTKLINMKFLDEIPRLVTGDNSLRKFLLNNCPVLSQKYSSPFWCPKGTIETLIASMMRKKAHVTFEHEKFYLPDGGMVLLSWANGETMEDVNDDEARPIAVVVPGLVGCYDDSYCTNLVSQAVRNNYRCVVLNNRGCGTNEYLVKRLYNSCNTGDLRCVLAEVKKRYPQSLLVAAGVSLGGMQVLHYAIGTEMKENEEFSDYGKKIPEAPVLDLAFAISTSWDVFQSAKSLNSGPLSRLLNKYLAHCLVRNFRSNKMLSEDSIKGGLDSVTYLRDFDEKVMAPMFGFRDCDEYYSMGSSKGKLHNVAAHGKVRRLVVLLADDDPFVPGHTIPHSDFDHENVALVQVSRGGHIGFLQGTWPFSAGSSLMERLFFEMLSAVHTPDSD